MFGKKKPDPAEAKRQMKTATRSGVRDVEKELRVLDREDERLVKEIKKTAKGGNQSATRTLARQLVQLRAHKERLLNTKAHISAAGYKGSAMVSQAQMATIMGTVTDGMKQMNDAVSASDIAATMREFEKQNETMNMREDLLTEALADAFDGDGVEAESDMVVNQVLDELGVELAESMPSAPRRAAEATATPEATAAQENAALDAQTERLLQQLGAL